MLKVMADAIAGEPAHAGCLHSDRDTCYTCADETIQFWTVDDNHRISLVIEVNAPGRAAHRKGAHAA